MSGARRAVIVAAPDWSDGETVEADLIIVGAGVVGLAMAHAFLDTPLKVLVLEGGGWQPTTRGQDTLWAEVEGAPNHSFAFSRFRAFGGSGAHWAGLCPSLEPIDFDGVGGRPAWPIGPEDLRPWLRRAEALLHVPLPSGHVAAWARRIGSAPDLGPSLRPVVLPVARRPDVGATCRAAFEASANVCIALNSDVLEIDTDAEGRRAEFVRVALDGGRRVRCKAAHVVLAAGGVENARLLLLSGKDGSRGLGTGADQVGRGFMDHIYCYAGHLEPAQPGAATGPHVVERFADLGARGGGIVAYTLDAATRRREGLNGAAAFFMHRAAFQLHPDYDSPGGQAVTHFAEIARGERFFDRSTLPAAGNVLRHAPAAVRLCLRHAAEVLRPQPRLALRMQVEASPSDHSRVTLAEGRDRLGRRRARVTWHVREADGQGAHRLWTALAEALAQRGIGRLVGAPPGAAGQWPPSTTGGKHHMGTTRMSTDASKGVVDPDCRIHGLSNVHVAGTSVFPTGGWANPTLTAIALALRLAAHLRR